MTCLLVVKLLRDLRATWTRVVLMVVAISVSLVVFSAVLYTCGIADREISRGYLSTNPASATVLLDRGVDAGQMAAIAAEARTRPGIIDATARTQFTTQIQHAGGRWRANPLQIFVAAPDDQMRIARFEVEQGSWPPAAGDILIDRDTLTLLDLSVGDTVVVKTPSGAPARLRVAGVAHDPSLAPASQEQKGYGFLSAASLPLLGEPAVLDEVKIQVTDRPGQATPSRDRTVIAAAGRDLGDWLQRTRGLAVREVQVPQPYAHPHKGQLDALLLALLVFGAAALLLSAILVATMLNGLFTQQIPQIGIMKATGARTALIARVYLLMTLAVAVTATALAVVPGVLISRAWVPAILTGLLGMDAASLVAPWWTYVVVLAAGLVLPPLMALIPLVKASRTTVRAAIDHHGLGSGSSAPTRLDAWLGRLPGLDRALLMALRNTIRRRARFLLSVGLLASAGALFVAGLSTLAGVQAVPEQAKQHRHWDVEVQLTAPTSAATLASTVQRIPHIGRVEAWTVAPAGVAEPGRIGITRTYPDQGHGSVAVTAIPAGTTMMTPPRLLEGRWLQPGETGAVVLNQIARANTIPDIRAGDTVQLSVGGHPTTWRVVGIAEEMFVGTGAYVTTDGYAQATGRPDQANVLRIATDRHDEQTRTAVADTVERVLTDASVKVRSAASIGQMETASTGHLLPITVILLAIAVAMGVVGCIGLASTMSVNVLERTREFAIMHAIGARAATVRRLVIAEGIFTALASCLAAAVPALALTAAMGAGLGNLFMYAPLPFRVSLPAVGIWIAVVVLGATLATTAPASRASRLTVREALAYL
jgi:putative ABC transport system permease protein